MTCPFCHSDARPSQAMGADMRLYDACSDCGRALAQAFADPLLQTVEIAPAPAETRPRVQAQPAPTDVLSLAKSRLAQLETELEALAGKQREADMLRRMIAAATPPN